MTDGLVLPAFGRVRTPARSLTWWGRAWVRTFEEHALAQSDLVAGRRLSRAGVLGATGVAPGCATGVLTDVTGEHLLVRVDVARLTDAGWRDFAAEVARASGHAADLVAGVLTPALVEHCDEVGVELLPGPADVETDCACQAWAQPCAHALAFLYQLAWLIDADPFVLLLLRGRGRDRVLGQVSGLLDAARATADDQPGDPADLAELAELDDAMARAREILAIAAEAPDGHGLADSAVAAYDERVARLL